MNNNNLISKKNEVTNLSLNGVYMNNNNLISCQDLSDIRYFLSKLASEHCTDIERIDNLICKLTSLQVNLQYNHPLLIKDNVILIKC